MIVNAEYLRVIGLLKIVYSAKQNPDNSPSMSTLIETSISPLGKNPTTKLQPKTAMINANIFLIVNASLKNILLKIVTKIGPVYSSVTAKESVD